MPSSTNLFPTRHNIPQASRTAGGEEGKVTDALLCPCSSKGFFQLNPPCALSHPRVRKDLYPFSFKQSYLFLPQLVYEELTSGLAAMTVKGNIFVLPCATTTIQAQWELSIQLESGKTEWKKWVPAVQRNQLPRATEPRGWHKYKGHTGLGGKQTLHNHCDGTLIFFYIPELATRFP